MWFVVFLSTIVVVSTVVVESFILISIKSSSNKNNVITYRPIHTKISLTTSKTSDIDSTLYNSFRFQQLMIVEKSKSRNNIPTQHQQFSNRRMTKRRTILYTGSHNYLQTSKDTVTLAGSILPILRKFTINPEKFKNIIHNIIHVTDWQDIIFLSIVAIVSTKPFIKFIFQPKQYIYKKIIQLLFWNKSKISNDDIDNNDNDKDDENDYYNNERLQQSKRYRTIQCICQIGQVAISVYIVDVLCIVLTTIGFTFPTVVSLSSTYAKVAYTILLLNRLLIAKKFAIRQFFYNIYQSRNAKSLVGTSSTGYTNSTSNNIDTTTIQGQIDIINRLCNIVIISIVTLVLFDWLSVTMGRAITGIFAFGSIGTLAFTLASQGLVTQFLSGIFLILGSKLYIGEVVKFGDGTQGKIQHLGWMDTIVRASDNIETRIPNNILASQKVSNMSRTKISQVKQIIRFKYEDASILPTVLDDIRSEIISNCPKLIVDGSRPLRIVWTDFQDDHLQVMVDTHYTICPIGDEYWYNRQTVLQCIVNACNKNNIDLAKIHAIATTTSDGTIITSSRSIETQPSQLSQQQTQMQQEEQTETIPILSPTVQSQQDEQTLVRIQQPLSSSLLTTASTTTSSSDTQNATNDVTIIEKRL